MRCVGLLRHGADQACEIRQIARYRRLAKGDVGAKPFKRISMRVIRRLVEEGAGRFCPELRRSGAERFFTLEMMKVSPLRHAGRLA